MKKKLTVFGLGVSGISAIKAGLKSGHEVYAVNQGEVKNWANYEDVRYLIPESHLFSQDQALEHFGKTDLIVISPGIPSNHPILMKAHQNKVPIISEIEFGCQFIQVPIIAITGTNGKTTTTTMIGKMIENAGLVPFVCGNIGTPVCDLAFNHLKPDVIVMEVSSFQLETIEKFKPTVALILNITPNHGERYLKHEDYAKAKFNIVKNMTEKEHLVFHEDNEMIFKWAKNLKLDLHPYSYKNAKSLLEKKYDLTKFKLVGDHNLYNLYCASLAVELLGERFTKGIQATISQFTGVPHRIEFVGEFKCGRVYNDAKSTNILSTLTAIRSFPQTKNLFLMLGGKKRGLNDSLREHLPELKKYVDTILLVGETTDMLFEDFDGNIKVEKMYDYDSALNWFKNKKGTLLLSPSYPSFDQFKNYVNRGETFKTKAKAILS